MLTTKRLVGVVLRGESDESIACKGQGILVLALKPKAEVQQRRINRLTVKNQCPPIFIKIVIKFFNCIKE